jgi:hypothetical protein
LRARRFVIWLNLAHFVKAAKIAGIQSLDRDGAQNPDFARRDVEPNSNSVTSAEKEEESRFPARAWLQEAGPDLQ